VPFQQLVEIMMDADLMAAGVPIKGKGQHDFGNGRFGWVRRP